MEEFKKTVVFDANYLARLRGRDPETEQHFVAHFSTVIWLRLRRRLRSKELISDIRQETFLRVVRFLHNGGQLDRPESLGAYVLSVSNNVMLEFIRGDARHPLQDETEPELVDMHLDIETELVTAERKQAVAGVLAQLPDKDRQILEMIFLEEADRADVCRQFHVENEYLRVLLHRAKQKFRSALNGATMKASNLFMFFHF